MTKSLYLWKVATYTIAIHEVQPGDITWFGVKKSVKTMDPEHLFIPNIFC